jgi:ferredoxin-NADP reductase
MPAPARVPTSRASGWQVARLISKRTETAAAMSFRFAPERWAGHRSGQHLDLRLTAEDGYQAERSYSIASAPEDAALELTVERTPDGEVSAYLVDEMAPGDAVEVRGPIGGWFVWDVEHGGPLLLIAGGSGIVPLMAMLRHRHRRGSRIPARLVVSARTAEDLFYAGELAALAAEDDGFQLTVTVTRGPPLLPGGPTGRVDAAMLARVAWPLEQHPLAFVCGPTSFVEHAANLLVDLGYPPELLKAERFGPSGTGPLGGSVDPAASGAPRGPAR